MSPGYHVVLSVFGRRFVKHFYALRYFKTNHQSNAHNKNATPNIVKETDTTQDLIRNFSIIAHVDHGKSTLADRFLEICGSIKPGSASPQMLDQLQVEKERGITVKAVTASLDYEYNGSKYLLNLIDTPGHVDFSNEVVRSVSACQGVILLVDANEGIQAQTVAVHSLAKRNNLTIIPVLNKIDLPMANPEAVAAQLYSLFKIEPDTIFKISAKKGWGVREVLDAIVTKIPPPSASTDGYFKAFTFDSWYDRYRGIMSVAYVVSGIAKVGDSVKWSSSPKQQTLKYISMLRPHEEVVQSAVAGQVVGLGCGPKSGGGVGEILTDISHPLTDSLSLPPVKHMVYAGIFPADQSKNLEVQSALDKLVLNDSAVTIMKDSSPALGQGWRVGFLGLLHLEVFSQRLFQEHKAEAILTAPSVPYKIKIKGAKNIKMYGEEVLITNPSQYPIEESNIVEYLEPLIKGTIVTPVEYLGSVTSLCLDRRGVVQPSSLVDEKHILLQFILPLTEIVYDFHDMLKSVTSGFASFDYEDHGFHPSPMVRMEVLLNSKPVEELCMIVHKSRIQSTARKIVEKLREEIPRQMIQINIQAMVNGKVVARETIKAYRKDVTAKLYGGDITRRMKLLRQQAEGKKEMRSVANIKVPRDTFINVLKR